MLTPALFALLTASKISWDVSFSSSFKAIEMPPVAYVRAGILPLSWLKTSKICMGVSPAMMLYSSSSPSTSKLNVPLSEPTSKVTGRFVFTNRPYLEPERMKGICSAPALESIVLHLTICPLRMMEAPAPPRPYKVSLGLRSMEAPRIAFCERV